jgi:hypothetical protein
MQPGGPLGAYRSKQNSLSIQSGIHNADMVRASPAFLRGASITSAGVNSQQQPPQPQAPVGDCKLPRQESGFTQEEIFRYWG